MRCKKNRYIPKKGNFVVGVVILRVDVGGTLLANLSMLAFEGATKKMKPDVNVGTVVCRLSQFLMLIRK